MDPDGNILGVPPSNSQNFEGAGVGTCLVWGLSYSGALTAAPGDNVNTDALSDGEYDLSDNYITVYRDEPDGGTVATTDGETEVTITAGDGADDIIEFASEGTSNSKFT